MSPSIFLVVRSKVIQMHLSNRTIFPCAVAVRAADIDDSAQGQVSRSWAGVEWSEVGVEAGAGAT